MKDALDRIPIPRWLRLILYVLAMVVGALDVAFYGVEWVVCVIYGAFMLGLEIGCRLEEWNN